MLESTAIEEDAADLDEDEDVVDTPTTSAQEWSLAMEKAVAGRDVAALQEAAAKAAADEDSPRYSPRQ